MMRGKVAVLVMALAIALMGVNGYAMPIHFEDDPLHIEAVVVNDVKEVMPAEVPEEVPEEATEEVTEAVSEEAMDAAPEEVTEEVTEEAADQEEAAEAEAEGEDELTEEEAAEDEPYTVDITDGHILTRLSDGSILIFVDGQYLKVAEDAFADVIAQVGAGRIDRLPKVEDLIPLSRNNRGDDVKALQKSLQELGYLSGSIDGQYGGQTNRAISSFEADMGLKQTGLAGQLLQLLIASAHEKPINVTSHFDPAMRYAAIAGKTTVDLDALAENNLYLDYDDIAGSGTISNGNAIALDTESESDIDSYVFDIHFVLLVNQNEDGEVIIEPGIQVNCECVRRPIMQEILLKSGDMRVTVPVSDLQNSLAGAKSIESGTALLNEEAVQLLANAAEEGELKLRINCKYTSFDGEVTEDDLISVSEVGKAAQAL